MKTTDSETTDVRLGRIPPTLPFRAGAPLKVTGWQVILALLGFLTCLYAFTAPTRAFVAEHPRQNFSTGLWSEQNLAAFFHRREELNGLYIGSSRVVRGIVPEVVDKVMLASGRPSQSLNLGNTGMNFIEQVALLDKLMEWGLADIEWVVFEVNEFDPRFGAHNRRSPRFNGWHSPAATRDMLSILWASERSLIRKISDSFEHVLELACNQAGTGQALIYWNQNYGKDQPRRPGRVALSGGYNAFPDVKVIPEKGFKKSLLMLEPRPDRVSELTELHRRLYAELDAKLRAAGVLPIFVRMPGFRRKSAGMQVAEAGALPCAINAYSDESYADIFKQENFYDKEHLNDTGARRFSRVLAKSVLSLFKKGALEQLSGGD